MEVLPAAEAEARAVMPRKLLASCIATVMAGFKTADLANPDEFVHLATEALEDFPGLVLARMASAKTGILRTAKFMPSIAEMIQWCTEERKKIEWTLVRARSITRNHRLKPPAVGQQVVVEPPSARKKA